MSIDFDTLKTLSVPQGVVTKITDSNGVVLWDSSCTITITSYEGDYITCQVTIDGITYMEGNITSEESIVLNVPIGTEIFCQAQANNMGGGVYVNNTMVTSTGYGSKDYTYTVVCDASIYLKSEYSAMYGNLSFVKITET